MVLNQMEHSSKLKNHQENERNHADVLKGYMAADDPTVTDTGTTSAEAVVCVSPPDHI